MSKVGRNDLCPCGSGKKYKKCCLPLDSIFDPSDTLFNRYNNLLTHTKLKLEETYVKEIRKARKEAQQLFLQYSTNPNLATDQESLFSDWLWFDKTDSAGDTLGFHYLQVNNPHMEPELSSVLTALSLSYLSIYEVLGKENEFLVVKDIFTQLEVKVLIREDAAPANNLLLLGRLAFMPEASIFSGLVLAMDNEDNRKEFLINHFNYIKEISNDTLANILKFKGPMILGLFDHAYQKQMVNINDVRYATISPADSNNLISSLQNDTNFTQVYDISGYKWFKPLNSDKGYIRMAVSDENLIISADIIDDIYYLQSEVTSIIPNLDFTVISSNFLDKPPKPSELEVWFTIMKDQETERWLKTPMQDLAEKTPLEVLEEADGKNNLLNILNSLDNENNTEEQKEFLAYLKERVNMF